MKYEYAMRVDNVYVIDTKMFGFEHYMSAFLVAKSPTPHGCSIRQDGASAPKMYKLFK